MKKIPGAVAAGENQSAPSNDLSVGKADAPQLPAFQVKALHPGVEAQIRSRLNQGVAHGLDHVADPVAAHVGVVDVGDLLRRAVVHQGLHDAGNPGALDSRDELAVAKGARSALAVANVAVRIQLAPSPIFADLEHARMSALAPFEQNRADAVLQKS